MKSFKLMCEGILPHIVEQFAYFEGMNFDQEKKSFNPWKWWIDNAKKFSVISCNKNELEPKHGCYKNSILKAYGAGENGFYVEGFVLVHGFPTKHAWNIIDSVPIDYTISDATRWEYYGAVVPQSVAMKAAMHKGWMKSTGVLSTMYFFSDKDLEIWAKKLR